MDPKKRQESLKGIGVESEEFLREFQEHLKMSNDLIKEFKEKIYWKEYLQENSVNYDVMKKIIFKTDFKSTKEFKTSHLNEKQKFEIDQLLKLKQIF